MVREIIHLQVGQCGNQVGSAIWKQLFAEHGLGDDGVYDGKKATCDEKKALSGINVYFSDPETGKYVPRALVVDLEPGTVDVIKASAIGPNFKDDNMLFGNNGAGNNWAKGHYTEGAELIENVLDKTRKEVERADCPQGFQICHSLGGGTGSGMGTLLLLKIRDAYPDRITKTYSVYPSPKVSDTVVEPYNAVLSSHQLLENSDETFIIDNEALYNISNNVMKNPNPQYSFLNALIARVVTGVTCSLRFPGQLNGDLRKLGVNLVPFPRLHFFLISIAPIGAKATLERTKQNVDGVSAQVISPSCFYANVKPEDGKNLAVSFIYRGANLQSSEIDKAVANIQNKHGDNFVEWIPNNIKSSLIDVAESDHTLSVTFIANTTALKGIYQRLATQFGAMYKRKAFLHWYKGEGMDEMEFQEADKNVRDLITEYQDKQDATVANSDDEDQDDDEDI